MSQRDGSATGGVVAPPRPADVPQSALGSSLHPTGPSLAERIDPSTTSHVHADQTVLDSPAADPIQVIRGAIAGRLGPAGLVNPVDIFDSALDTDQRDAVARALAAPDLFVIAGPTGTGKTRVILELVRQTVQSGGRVLLLSPDMLAIDCVLPALSKHVTVMRRLGPGEVQDRLGPAIAALTREGRQKTARESIVRRATESVAAAEQRRMLLDSLVLSLSELIATRGRLADRSAQRESLHRMRDALPIDVARAADTDADTNSYFIQRVRGAATAHARRIAAFDAAGSELRAARAAAECTLRAAQEECRILRPRVEALQSGRWYSLSFWKARADAGLTDRLAAAETRMAAAKTDLDELAIREQKLAVDRRLADEEYASERARLLDAEIAKRRADLDIRIGQLDRDAAADTKRESELAALFTTAGIDPSIGVAGVEQCRVAAEHEVQLARATAESLPGQIDSLVCEATKHAAVVAGPVASVAADADVVAQAPFDLLIVDDAHRMAEKDFVAAAHLARRWILAGRPTGLPAGKHRGSQPDLFARLVSGLRHEVWIRDGARLVCRLYPVRGAERRKLECEPVADAPDIELRLFTPNGHDPTLAEVAFPERMTVAAAREYLYLELGEVTCNPVLRSVIWEIEAGRIVLRFAPGDPTATLAEVGPGVREEICGLETRAIHFDSNWTVETARAWAAENVARRDTGRLVQLTKPYRACPGLARWLNRAFAMGFAIPTITDDVPHVEFLAVPDTEPRRRYPANGRPGRVGGAGYEIDLADGRQRAALPAEFADLPASGFVNLPEAQAIARHLEAIPVGDVAVTSPFPTQVIVLRRLFSRSPRLAEIRILDSADAVVHECDLLVVSLTRSHVGRAVTFGEHPRVLSGLLGRARTKILFAGDPGTLARRLQWEGPVDHLDALAAASERDWISALADCPRIVKSRSHSRGHENRHTT